MGGLCVCVSGGGRGVMGREGGGFAGACVHEVARTRVWPLCVVHGAHVCALCDMNRSSYNTIYHQFPLYFCSTHSTHHPHTTQVQYAAMDVVSTITCFTALMHTHTQKHGRASLSHLHQAWCARGEGARVVSRGSRWSPDAHPAMQAPVPRPKPDWMLAAAGGCGGEEGGVGGG